MTQKWDQKQAKNESKINENSCKNVTKMIPNISQKGSRKNIPMTSNDN